MRQWRSSLIHENASIRETIEAIDANAMQIALVINKDGGLLGSVTDGDVRRGILKGIHIDQPVHVIMNKHPTTVSPDMNREEVLTLMKHMQIHQVPIVDKKNRVIGIEVLDELIQTNQKDNWVILMAGGIGSRLRPLTVDIPKPMLRIGNKPILETILENFVQYGFSKFFISVNYKAHIVKDYFSDGRHWGIEIQYIHEDEQLGTAGALQLLPDRPNDTVLVMNGDLLTKVNFDHLLDFHKRQQSKATMCVREYDFQVPYGVVRLKDHQIVTIDEKPLQRFFVNAGIYVLEPEVIGIIPKNEPYDMPSLFQEMIERKLETVVFPIREYWIDIGQVSDLNKANGEFEEIFLDRDGQPSD